MYRHLSSTIADTTFPYFGGRLGACDIGHPMDVIVQLAICFFSLVDVDSSHTGIKLKSDDLMASRKLLSILKCIAMIPAWPQNCYVLHSRLGDNFASLILGVVDIYIGRIEAHFSSDVICYEALNVDLSILLCSIQFLQNSLDGPRIFVDLIFPRQPFTAFALQQLHVLPSTEKKCDLEDIFTTKPPSEGNHSLDLKCSFLNLKGEWIKLLATLGVRTTLLGVAQKLDKIQNNIFAKFSHWEMQIDKELINSCGFIVILQCEILYFFTLFVRQSEELAHAFIEDDGCRLLHSLLSKSLPHLIPRCFDSCSFDMILLRRSLLALNIFTSLKGNNNSSSSPNVGAKFQGLSASSLGKFLGWCRLRFDTVIQGEDLSSLEALSKVVAGCDAPASFSLDKSIGNLPIPGLDLVHSSNMSHFLKFSVFDDESIKNNAWYQLHRSHSIWKNIFAVLNGFVFDIPPCFDNISAESVSISSFKFGLSVILSSIHRCTSGELSLRFSNSEPTTIIYAQIPFFQMAMLTFMKFCFSSMMEATCEVFCDTNLTSNILSPSFFSHFDCLDSKSAFNFETIRLDALKGLRVALSPKECNIVPMSLFSRLFVNDAILSFLFQFWNSSWISQSPSRCREGVLTILLLIINAPKKAPSDLLVGQIIRWLHSLMVKYDSTSDTFHTICCHSLSSCIILIHRILVGMGISKLEPSVLVKCPDLGRSDGARPFMWMARSSLVNFLLFLVNSPSHPWMDVFYDETLTDTAILENRVQMAVESTNESSSFRVSDGTEVEPPKTDSRNYTLGMQRCKYITYLLLDPRLRSAGMQLIIFLISSSASIALSKNENTDKTSGDKSVSSSQSNMKSEKSRSYQVIVDCIGNCLDVVGFSRKYPPFMDGMNASLLILSSFCWLIDDRSNEKIHHYIKTCCNQGDVMSHLLFSLMQFSRESSFDKQYSNLESLLVKNLKECLVFLGCLLCKHEGNKLELSAILSFGQNSEGTNKQKRSMDKKLRCISFDNFKSAMLKLEKLISCNTMKVFFDMLFDTPSISSSSNQLDQVSVVEGLFSSLDDDRPKIKNVAILEIIFGLIPFLPTSVQDFVLVSITNLVVGRGSLVNLSICSQSHPRVLDLAIELMQHIDDNVQHLCVELIRVLGSHDISVSQLKHLFQILQSKGDSRPSYTWRVLKSLHGMFSDYKGPLHSFVFEGKDSGLLLPPISKWPSKKGFSFCFWLCIEAPRSFNRKENHVVSHNLPSDYFMAYSPYILCFRDNNAPGFDIVLKETDFGNEFGIEIRTFNGMNESQVFCPENTVICEGQWHFLSVSLSSGQSFYAKDDLSILVDDKFNQWKVSNVKLPENVSRPMIGACSFSSSNRDVIETLRGQLSTVYFFGESLSESQMRGIRELGPQYSYSFEPLSAEYVKLPSNSSRKPTVNPLSILDGSLTSMLVLVYNPSVFRGDFFLDNTPIKNEVKWKSVASNQAHRASSVSVISDEFLDPNVQIIDATSGCVRMHAHRLVGTERSTKQDVRMALDSLGGLITLLPLFIQFDQPRLILSRSETSLVSKFSTDFTLDSFLCPSVMDLLTTVLNDVDNQVALKRISGMSIVGYFFERISPRHITMVTLGSFLNFFEILSINGIGAEAVLDKILSNFKIWALVNSNIQLSLIDWLIAYASNSLQKCREVIPIHRITEALYWIYDYDLPTVPDFETEKAQSNRFMTCRSFSKLLETDPILSGINSCPFPKSLTWILSTTGEVCGQVPVGQELTDIRNGLFLLLERMICRSNILPEDIESVVSYCVMASSNKAKSEGIGFLFKVLLESGSSAVPVQVLLGFAHSRCLPGLFVLFTHPCLHIRLKMLVLFCQIVEHLATFKILPEISHDSKYFASITSLSSSESFAYSAEALALNGLNLAKAFLSFSSDLFCNLNDVDENSRKIFCGMAMFCLLKTLLGSSLSGLMDDINHLSLSNELKSSENFVSPFFVSNLVTSDCVCFPTLILPIFDALISDYVSEELKIAVLDHLIQIILTNPINCDHFLRVELWHTYLIKFLLNQTGEVLTKTQEFISTIFEACVNLGKPLLPGDIYRIGECKQTLSYFDCLKEMSRGERHLSASNLRDCLVSLEMIPCSWDLKAQCAFQLIDLFISALSSSQRSAPLPSNTSGLLLAYSEKINHFDHCLVAFIAMEFLNNIFERSSSFDVSFLLQVIQKLLALVVKHIMSPSDWMVEERSFRVHAGSLDVSRALDNSLKMNGSGQTNAQLNIRNNNAVSTRRIPLTHMPGGIGWSVIHIITKAFSFCSRTCNDSLIKEIGSIADQLLAVFSTCFQREAIFVDVDVLFVVASLYRVLASKSSAFQEKMTDVILWLVFNNQDIFRILFLTFQYNKKINRSVTSLTTLNDICFLLHSLNITIPEKKRGFDETLSLMRDIYGSSSVEAIEDAIQDILFGGKILNHSLIMEAMEFVYREVSMIEESIVGSRFLEMGFSGNFQEKLLNSSLFFQEFGVLIQSQSSLNDEKFCSVVQDQLMRYKDSIRAYDIATRKVEENWNDIWSDLANERGPWGIIGQGENDIFWTLDNVENNRLLKVRLRRNENGTRHLVATQKAQGILRDRSESSGSDTTTSESDKGMWKVLMKYKPKNTAFVDENEDLASVDPNSDIHEEDDDVVSEDTHRFDFFSSASDATLFSCPVEIITVASCSVGARTSGTLEVTKNKLTFTRQNENERINFVNKSGNNEFLWACESFPSTTWLLSDIVSVLKRRFLMRKVGMEIFFSSRRSVFFNLMEIKEAKKVYKLLLSIYRSSNPNLTSVSMVDALTLWMMPGSNRNMTLAWVNREVSNFDYLMYLNVQAGRTFNDLSQYPVFPWVIADYTSSKLDLKDPSIYRDFRWPMGAQLESQRELMQEKYENLKSLDDCPPYHNGSHFSTSGFVVWYLIRMEPFTSLHVWLQDGKFDKPDRLFYSIEAAYRGCTTNVMDVKELVPEFFCNPDFLENTNGVDLGTMQNGRHIGHVQLPPWARNAHDFIRINREALESEHVSRNLHHWVDLIFGYKQNPNDPATVEACNVYNNWTYQDAVDLEELKISQPNLYQTALRQIDCFGQTPAQLFSKPHPARIPMEKWEIIWPIASALDGVNTVPKTSQPLMLEKPNKVLCFDDFKLSNVPIVFIHENRDVERLITIDTSRLVGIHGFKVLSPDVVPPYSFKIDSLAVKWAGQSGDGVLTSFLKNYTINANNKERRVGVAFASPGLMQGGVIASSYSHRFNLEWIGTSENKNRYLSDEMDRAVKRDKGKEKDGEASPASPLISDSSLNLSGELSSDVSRRSNRSVSNHGAHTSRSRNTRSRINTKRQSVDDHLAPHLFDMLPEGKLLFSCGHWDNSFRVSCVDSGKLSQTVLYHRDVVTCLSVVSDFNHSWLITGSRDCTVAIWEIFIERDNHPVQTPPLHLLCGHDSAVNCVAVNPELDIVVSGSDDGTIIMHTLRDGMYLRSLNFGEHKSQIVATPAKPSLSRTVTTSLANSSSSTPSSSSSSSSSLSSSSSGVRQINTSIKRRVHRIVVSKEGFIVAYSMDGNIICTYSLNGRLLRMIDVGERIHCMCLSEDGKVLITGGDRCLVVLRWVATLFLANNGSRRDLESVIDGFMDRPLNQRFSSPIRSLLLTNQERHLIVGLESGEIRLLAQDSEYLRKRLHKKLMEIGILPQSEDSLDV